MKTAKITICFVAALLAIAIAAQAEDFTMTGKQSIDVKSIYDSGFLYDYSMAYILIGGNVTHLETYDDSTTSIITGGSAYNLYVYDNSTAGVAGGSVRNLYAYDTSTTNISGGNVENLNAFDLRPDGPQRVNIIAGTVTKLNPVILLKANEYLNYAADLTLSDLASYGLHAAPGTVGTISPMSFTEHGASALDITGGSIANLYAYDTSTANLTGGSITNLYAYDTSTMNLPSGKGKVEYLNTYNTSTANISSESVGYLNTYDSSTVNISGGYVNFLDAYDSSTINISGGELDLYTFDSSTANISGGSIVNLSACGTVNISGGIIKEFEAHCDVNISGGEVYRLDTSSNSILNISGGGVKYLNAYNSSTINITGGIIDRLGVYGDSTVIFKGYDFTLGDGLSWDIDGQTILGTGTLIGKWFNDATFVIPITYHDANATIMAIPEPATLVLLSLASMLLRRKNQN